MKRAAPFLLLLAIAHSAFAQVDVESRRTVLAETGFALKGDEQPSAYGYFWFREQASWTVWLGLPLVVASGFYILHRERLRARERVLTKEAAIHIL